MRCLIITQNDPFYLPDALNYFVKQCVGKYEIVGAVILAASPYGKKEPSYKKALKIFQVFGTKFFIYYTLKLIRQRLTNSKTLEHVFADYGVPVIKLSESINAQSSLDIIANMLPDVIISIAGNEVFKKPLLDIAPSRCLNLHTAKLPQYRGLMPTFWALLHEEKEIGVTVFDIDEGIDSGPILVQRNISIGERVQSKIIKETKKIGMDCMLEALEMIEIGNVRRMSNDADEATYFGFPTRADVKKFYESGARFF
jgi:methionyl-tRNA formyltransferase